ncbi:MAG: epimerase [Rhizobiales bacterium NRL2]|jgi:uncharacterized protein YbjT (DUF2867 family)|nr:MAG: epimerase [Rhizobiales bacterium NRL2]
MNIIVFGATGSIGRHVVRQALAEGHRVTAFQRTAPAREPENPNLVHQLSDVLDAEAVARAVHGQDAVVVALGAGRHGNVRAAGTRNIIAAMERHGPKRLVCLSTLGAGDSRHLLNFFWKRIMFGLLLRAAYADHQTQEQAVRESDLDWTLVRPGAFTDGDLTGDYRHGALSAADRLQLKVSRADVAHFMLGALSGGGYLRRAAALSY